MSISGDLLAFKWAQIMRWFYPFEPWLLYHLVKKKKKKKTKHGLFTAQKACCWSGDKIYICKHIFDWSKGILQKVPNKLKLVSGSEKLWTMRLNQNHFYFTQKKKKNIYTSSANNKLSITNNYNPNSLTIFKHIFWIILRSLLWTLEVPFLLGISDWVTTLSIKTQLWISDLVTSFGNVDI